MENPHLLLQKWGRYIRKVDPKVTKRKTLTTRELDRGMKTEARRQRLNDSGAAMECRGRYGGAVKNVGA